MHIIDRVGSKRKRRKLSPAIFPGREGSAEPLVSNSQRNGRAIKGPHSWGREPTQFPSPRPNPQHLSCCQQPWPHSCPGQRRLQDAHWRQPETIPGLAAGRRVGKSAQPPLTGQGLKGAVVWDLKGFVNSSTDLNFSLCCFPHTLRNDFRARRSSQHFLSQATAQNKYVAENGCRCLSYLS